MGDNANLQDYDKNQIVLMQKVDNTFAKLEDNTIVGFENYYSYSEKETVVSETPKDRKLTKNEERVKLLAREYVNSKLTTEERARLEILEYETDLEKAEEYHNALKGVKDFRAFLDEKAAFLNSIKK